EAIAVTRTAEQLETDDVTRGNEPSARRLVEDRKEARIVSGLAPRTRIDEMDFREGKVSDDPIGALLLHVDIERSRRESARSASVMSKSRNVKSSRAARLTTAAIAALIVSVTPLVPRITRACSRIVSSTFTVVLAMPPPASCVPP